jgi:hypothetical protein
MPAKAKVSQELARALSEMVARAPQMEPAAIITGLDDIEDKFLPLVGASEAMRLETGRRVAEWKFKLLCEADLPPGTINQLYAAVKKLGFADLETEVTIEIYLAQYLIRRSRFRDARRGLEALQKKLGSNSAHEYLRQDTARLLASLDP